MNFKIVVEYMQALISAVILAILIRGFIFEPFKIPSESMVPTLLVGDHIFVARYQYGLRVPFTKMWLTEFDGPERGDVVVFTFPDDEDFDYIKRVVGLPGDTVAIKNGELTVNGVAVNQQEFFTKGPSKDNCVMDLTELSQKKFPKDFENFPYYRSHQNFNHYLETMGDGPVHMVQRLKQHPIGVDVEVTVPERSYFVMGDNRDQSHDSRFWGMVPRENLKGKAIYIWLSLNHENVECAHNLISPNVFPNIRWDRFGRSIQ